MVSSDTYRVTYSIHLLSLCSMSLIAVGIVYWLDGRWCHFEFPILITNKPKHSRSYLCMCAYFRFTICKHNHQEYMTCVSKFFQTQLTFMYISNHRRSSTSQHTHRTISIPDILNLLFTYYLCAQGCILYKLLVYSSKTVCVYIIMCTHLLSFHFSSKRNFLLSTKKTFSST